MIRNVPPVLMPVLTVPLKSIGPEPMFERLLIWSVPLVSFVPPV